MSLTDDQARAAYVAAGGNPQRQQQIIEMWQAGRQPLTIEKSYGKFTIPNRANPAAQIFESAEHYGPMKIGDMDVQTRTTYDPQGRPNVQLMLPNGQFGGMNDIAKFSRDNAAQKEGMVEDARETAKNRAAMAWKPIGEAQDRGGQKAQDVINVLDRMDTQYQTGKVSGGPAGPAVVKIKQLANEVWPGLLADGLTESEVVRKSTAELALKAIKDASSRGGTQREFVAMLDNNPGIEMSNAGARYMIDILRQQAKQDQGIGALASQVKNAADWPRMLQEYYDNHPLISPITSKRLDGKAIAEDTDALRTAAATSPIGAAPPGGAAQAAPGGGAVRRYNPATGKIE